MGCKDYFEKVATQWDRMRARFFSEVVRDRALLMADVQPGKIAADLGAGSGFVAEGLLRKGLKVLAFDQSEAMLAVMKKKFGGAEDIEYHIGDSKHLPIPDETVDYAFANMYLHHVESPSQTIREMARITKHTGKVVITDLDQHSFEFLRVEHHDRWMGFKRDDIKEWLAEAGLKNVSVDCVGENCCAESSCGSERASVSIFVASGEK
jgi:ubiquinone/menaquinone biosynthesis C-methylase UbiE